MQGNGKFNKTIWMYWENRPFSRKPEYLNLCYETIEKHVGDYELKLLDDRTILDYIEIPPLVAKLKHIAHRADYIRFHLLHQYGGIWLDADIILLRNIGEAVDPYIEQYDYIGYGREYGKPSINFMACNPNCALLKDHIQLMDEKLSEKKSKWNSRKVELIWTEIGHDILWPLAQNYDYYHHDHSRFAPVYWRDWERFFGNDINLEEVVKDDPYSVMLYNDFMYKPLKIISRKELLEKENLLGSLYRYALR